MVLFSVRSLLFAEGKVILLLSFLTFGGHPAVNYIEEKRGTLLYHIQAVRVFEEDMSKIRSIKQNMKDLSFWVSACVIRRLLWSTRRRKQQHVVFKVIQILCSVERMSLNFMLMESVIRNLYSHFMWKSIPDSCRFKNL